MSVELSESSSKLLRRVSYLFGLLIVLAVTCMLIVKQIGDYNSNIADLQDQQAELLMYGDELRQSSDDLTRMARLYVLTGDSNYLEHYREIVAIRDGLAPRPIDYGGIYWDYILATGNPPRASEAPISLIDLLRSAGASEDQMEFFEEAKRNSDRLISLEEEAFKAMIGKFPDLTGAYTVDLPPDPMKARKILGGDAYNRSKSEIMAPIDEFRKVVRNDLQRRINTRESQNRTLFIILFAIIGFACLVMGIAAAQLFRFARLHRGQTEFEDSARSHGLFSEIRNNWTLLLATGVVCLGIVLFNFFAATEVVQKTEAGLSESLRTVHATTRKSVTSWLESLEREINELKDYYEFQDVTKELLSRSLVEADNSRKIELDYLTSTFIHDISYFGYVMANREGELVMSRIQQGSMDVKFNRENDLSLQNLLSGAKKISFEMPSKTGEPSDEFNRFLKIGIPVVRADSVYGAVFFLFLPDKTFTDFLQNGRLGRSGETIAFNKMGQMISESRFDELLRHRGVIKSAEHAILNVRMAVPADQTESGLSEPTRMAKSALKGISDIDIKGYKDYRGVEVAGIWSWNEKFGFGMCTEIDIVEAFEPQQFYQKVLASGSGLSIFLLLVLMVFSIRSRIVAAKQSRVLEKAFEQLKFNTDELERMNFLADTALDLTKAGYWHVPLDQSGFYNSSRKTVEINGDPPRSDFRYDLETEWLVNLKAADETLAEQAMQSFNAAVEGKKPFYDATYAYKRPKDGQIVYLRAIGKVKRHPGGDATDMYGVTQDITESVLTRRKIKENEDRLRLAQSIGHIGTWDWDILHDRMVWSDEMYSMLGLTRDEFVPSMEKFRAMVHPEDLDKVEDTIRGSLGQNEEFTVEHRIVLASGSTRYIRQTGKAFKNDKGDAIRFIATSIDVTENRLMQNELERAFETIKEQNARMSDELNIAQEIQMSMLPLLFPAFPLRADIDIYANLIPAREVGGDFYDFFFIDEEHLCFVVGDVSGKGVPAALMMAVCKTVIKSRSSNDLSPASILTHVNTEMARENHNYMFVTVFLAILNTRTGELMYCNAGHNPTYLISEGNTQRLTDLHGPVIAAMEGITYGESRVQLKVNDYIFAYTDGIPEAHNRDGELYSDSRLEAVLKDCARGSGQKLVEDVMQTVFNFENGYERFDDITALCIRYVGGTHKELHESFGLKIKNTRDDLKTIESRFTEFCDRTRIKKDICDKIRVVFDELLTNVIDYAFEDELEHLISIRVDLHTNKLVLTIEDDGKPFNPFQKDPPDVNLSMDEREIGGLGIHLVKNLMDEYNYKRLIGKNVVTLVKFDVMED
ncbi:MAG: SpoIIE family protein phosphatase [Flavobacteriales bacterium]|nr:SpoIIE family protein phosphatase [Flavobacteriales bacterium]